MALNRQALKQEILNILNTLKDETDQASAINLPTAWLRLLIIMCVVQRLLQP